MTSTNVSKSVCKSGQSEIRPCRKYYPRRPQVIVLYITLILFSSVSAAQNLLTSQQFWNYFQSDITTEQLIGLPADQAIGLLTSAGHQCGVTAAAIGAVNALTSPFITGILAKSTPVVRGCYAVEVNLITSPRDPVASFDANGGLLGYLQHLQAKKIGSVVVTCEVQAVPRSLLNSQGDGIKRLYEAVGALGLNGLSGNEAVMRLRGERFLCGSARDNVIECIRPHSIDGGCVVPLLKIFLAPQRDETSSKTRLQSIPGLVREIHAECSVPPWLHGLPK